MLTTVTIPKNQLSKPNGKTEVVRVRLTTFEKADLVKRAAEAGEKSLSDYLRKRAFSLNPTVPPINEGTCAQLRKMSPKVACPSRSPAQKLLVRRDRQPKSRLSVAIASPKVACPSRSHSIELTLFESRRKKLQRFLDNPHLTIAQIWWPLFSYWLQNNCESDEVLYIAIDRTQWKSVNLIFVSLIYQNRAIPIYFECLPKLGSTNGAKQIAVLSQGCSQICW